LVAHDPACRRWVNRRWWGALVVAEVLLATIVVPDLSERRVAGQPVAKEVAGPLIGVADGPMPTS